jgi:hypothetical protein
LHVGQQALMAAIVSRDIPEHIRRRHTTRGQYRKAGLQAGTENHLLNRLSSLIDSKTDSFGEGCMNRSVYKFRNYRAPTTARLSPKLQYARTCQYLVVRKKSVPVY